MINNTATKLQLNKEKLEKLKLKRENLVWEIENLEKKIKNQERALPKIVAKTAMEKAFPQKESK